MTVEEDDCKTKLGKL